MILPLFSGCALPRSAANNPCSQEEYPEHNYTKKLFSWFVGYTEDLPRPERQPSRLRISHSPACLAIYKRLGGSSAENSDAKAGQFFSRSASGAANGKNPSLVFPFGLIVGPPNILRFAAALVSNLLMLLASGGIERRNAPDP